MEDVCWEVTITNPTKTLNAIRSTSGMNMNWMRAYVARFVPQPKRSLQKHFVNAPRRRLFER